MRGHEENPPLGEWWIPAALALGLLGLGALALSQTEWAKLSPLERETRRRLETLLIRLRQRGIKIHIGSTLRSAVEQQKVLSEGKSGTSVSWHLTGRAADLYPIDPATGKPDFAGKRLDLYRVMHQEWAALGGTGLAFGPYPNGPVRYISTPKGPIWDGGHVEYRGPHATPAAAFLAEGAKAA